MSPAMSAAVSRTALVLLATAIVIAATVALTPRFDPRQELTALMQQAKSHPPSPASQAAWPVATPWLLSQPATTRV